MWDNRDLAPGVADIPEFVQQGGMNGVSVTAKRIMHFCGLQTNSFYGTILNRGNITASIRSVKTSSLLS